MPEKSTHSRMWVLTGFCGLLFIVILGVGSLGVVIYRHLQRTIVEIQRADATCRTWILACPKIAQELGTPTLGLSTGSASHEGAEESHGAAQFQYALNGAKSNGSVQVWLTQSTDGEWVVTGAILSRLGLSPVKIGSPPEPAWTTMKAN